MYELKQISEKCYYINCPAKIGVYVANKPVSYTHLTLPTIVGV